MVKFYKAHDGIHKYVAEFDDPPKKVKFGAIGYEDFTHHHDNKRKILYLMRHKNNENWNDPFSPGALSRWILWNKPTIEASIKDYIHRFRMRLD